MTPLKLLEIIVNSVKDFYSASISQKEENYDYKNYNWVFLRNKQYSINKMVFYFR